MTRTLLKLFWTNLLLFVGVLNLIQLQAQDRSENEGFTQPPDLKTLIQLNERFEYEVKYGPFTLGHIEVELLPDTTYQRESVHHLKTKMTANHKLIFVSKSEINYESLFSVRNDSIYAHLFWRDDIHERQQEKVKIIFDRESEEVLFFEDGEQTEVLDMETMASGGDIIFYYSRLFAGLDKPYSLPVYIEDEMGWVESVSSNETEIREYDAFNEPVETYMSEGTADIEGPFGFKGQFRSWFMTDEFRIPVEAHARVIFGNVKVRLISYEQRN